MLRWACASSFWTSTSPKISSARRLVPWTLGLGVAAVVIAWFAIY